MLKFIKSNWVLILILLTAIFFRFYMIKSFPNGLFPDEAANGLDINSIFQGHLQPFYERGNGREALFFYMLAASVAIFGRGPWQHHIVTGIVGVAEILVTYLLVKRLFGKRTALLASFFMSVSSYAVALNRNAFRANLIPLFTTLTFLFIVKFFQTPPEQKRSRMWSAAWAGISFGLGFYTYISYRMMPFILFALLVVLLFAVRDRIREVIKTYWSGIEAFIIGFLISFSWLGSYFIAHPKTFVGRAGEVSIFNKELNGGNVIGTFITVVKKTLMSFFTNGDMNWRQNVAGFPFLSPIISPFFAVSIIIFTLVILKFFYDAYKKRINVQTVYLSGLATWFWFMIVPEITTAEGIPHGLRIIGVIPPIFIASAWGVNKFWEWYIKYLVNKPGRIAFAAVFLGALGFYGYFAVFQVSAKSPEAYYAFRSDLTDVSDYLKARNDKNHTYLVLDAFSVQTTDYLTSGYGIPYIELDPANSWKQSMEPGDQMIFTQSTLYDAITYKRHHPEAKLVRQGKNQFGQVIMEVYEE